MISPLRFGTKTITQIWTNVHDNYWANGSFRIVSNSEVLIYPPQALTPATYAITVSNKPSVAPGFYNLAIGNNFTNLWLFPRIGFDANGVAAQKLNTVAAMKGLTIYMQAGLLDLTPSATWPLPVSDSFSTTYR
jgi:hypothetical protein